MPDTLMKPSTTVLGVLEPPTTVNQARLKKSMYGEYKTHKIRSRQSKTSIQLLNTWKTLHLHTLGMIILPGRMYQQCLRITTPTLTNP